MYLSVFHAGRAIGAINPRCVKAGRQVVWRFCAMCTVRLGRCTERHLGVVPIYGREKRSGGRAGVRILDSFAVCLPRIKFWSHHSLPMGP